MNKIVFTALAATVIVATSALAHGGDGDAMPCCQTGAPAKPGPATAAKLQKGVQKFTVKVDGTYSPSSLSVKAGKPVEITFVKGKNVGCGGTVVFSSLGITKELKADKTVVAFTPKKAGTIAFACPMGMYRGSIAVK